MRRVGTQERRARLGVRHRLAVAAQDPVEAARAVVALHATDPASVFLAVHARSSAPGSAPSSGTAAAASIEPAAVERALYEDRTLIRLIGMRRTVFVVPLDAAPVVTASCTRTVAAQSRRRYLQLMAAGGLGEGPQLAAWLAEVEDATVRALRARGEATGAELSADEPRLRTSLAMAEGKPYEGRQNITTWVLFLLAADGRIVRGRPRGSWASSQYRWSPMEQWLPEGVPELPVEQARVELVRRWLAAYGPGTLADLRWWTGWPAGQVKAALTEIGPVEVDLGGATGLVLPGDAEPAPAAPPTPPWVALLPALDPTAMGWIERSWYLGEHAAPLFDRTGNIGPTVWVDGRIVGGWAQRPGGEVVTRLLEDVGAETARAVDERAARLTEWIGPVRVTPRFRTPLERELAGGAAGS